jgi:hypothetical protein
MQRTIFLILLTVLFMGCKKELDFEYHEIAPIVVIEGMVSNEGAEVKISHSRSVTDSVRSHGEAGGQVTIQCKDTVWTLAFDWHTGYYRSALKSIPGNTYQLRVDFEGQHYEAEATMPPPAPILSAGFQWMPMLDTRFLFFEAWATDPDTEVENYFWFRIDRHSSHPYVVKRHKNEVYRWGIFDERGCPPGRVFHDVSCVSEETIEENEEDKWNSILYEGDAVMYHLMTIDKPTFDYLRALRSGQSGGANPASNISGGCLGFFTATSITHADTIMIHYDELP